MLRSRVVLTLAFVAALVATGGCAGGGDGSPQTAGDGLHVVVTTPVLGDLVSELVQEDGEVTVLMEPGVDAHAHAPSARDATTLREADLVVANGLGLEAQLTDLVDAAEEDGVPVLRLAEELDPLPAGESLDPHVWLDPQRMAAGVGLLAEAIARADGPERLDDATWTQRGEQLADRLLSLDAELAAQVDALPPERRALITNHDSLAYLAERYGFEVVATVVPGTSSQAGASARDVAELAALIVERDVPAIFVEDAESSRLAESLASEAGRDVQVVTLQTANLGPECSGAEDYEGMMRTAIDAIVTALAP